MRALPVPMRVGERCSSFKFGALFLVVVLVLVLVRLLDHHLLERLDAIRDVLSHVRAKLADRGFDQRNLSLHGSDNTPLSVSNTLPDIAVAESLGGGGKRKKRVYINIFIYKINNRKSTN